MIVALAVYGGSALVISDDPHPTGTALPTSSCQESPYR
jgi:hypothetical protein